MEMLLWAIVVLAGFYFLARFGLALYLRMVRTASTKKRV